MIKFFLSFSLFLLFLLFNKSISAATIPVTQANQLQNAADSAQNGDTIIISGNLSSVSQFTPFEGKMNVQSCFVNLRGKDLTLKGGTLYGQGHDIGKHEQGDPYYHRVGICSRGGNVVIEGIHIKEFEGGGLQFFDARVTLKNNLIDGNDHGGLFIFNSSLLAVNNNFVANIGIIPFGNSIIKAFNNTFYYSKAIIAAVSCNDNVPQIDFINNLIVDPELTIGIGGLSTNCPEKVSQFKDQNIKYNLQWKTLGDSGIEKPCYPHEYCNHYIGKVNADPIINVCTEPRGFCGGSLEPQAGSPAIGAGDQSVPGKKDLGATGGPCTDGNSGACQQFIQTNAPPTTPPTPTPAITGITNIPPGGPGTTTGGGQQQRQLNFNKILLSPFYMYSTATATMSAQPKGFEEELFLYIVMSVVYLMVIHFAVTIGNEFNLWFMLVFFILGGIVGWWIGSWMGGFALAVILSLLFW